MKSYVVDASVAAKWFLPSAQEPLAIEARQLLEEHAAGHLKIEVPDLFWPELGNILWKAVRVNRMTRQTAEEAIAALEGSPLITIPSASLWKDAFALAVTFDRTVYDSIYVALAVVSGISMVTADEQLANALAAHLPVRWLGALPFSR
ncbi:MAG: type II toxin-antitoxin system VapC family toxin [Bryobacterales bacterium]|nr:type II toxin-antitoxin system VapC family toxin [Bryobacterales bacterium]